jgi:hypothetical protein
LRTSNEATQRQPRQSKIVTEAIGIETSTISVEPAPN